MESMAERIRIVVCSRIVLLFWGSGLSVCPVGIWHEVITVSWLHFNLLILKDGSSSSSMYCTYIFFLSFFAVQNSLPRVLGTFYEDAMGLFCYYHLFGLCLLWPEV